MAGTSKSSRKSKIVTLTLTSAALAQFPATSVKSETTSGILDSSEDKSSEDATPGQIKDEGEETPADGKKKRQPPNPNARKRAPPAIDPDAPPRDRARPGPKKRARTDGVTDSAEKDAKTSAPLAASSHKLGPKANTGAINAGLRALDRSGKPCRRWERKGFQLKSFTGEMWAVPTWKGSQRPKLNADGEMQSDSSSDAKPIDASGVPSENSAMDAGDTTMMNGIESSPAPIAA